MPGIKHGYHSGAEDGADASLVRPSDWNEDHIWPTMKADIDTLGVDAGSLAGTPAVDILDKDTAQVATNKTLKEVPYLTLKTDAGAPPYEEGALYWDAADHTLALMTETAQTTIQVGQEDVVKVLNKTGAEITDTSIVYLLGAQGNRPTIALADADNEHESYVLGVATMDIPDNGSGYVTTRGVVRGVNTSNLAAGDLLYLSSTPGQFTASKPIAPQHSVVVGVALNSTTNGSVYVSPNVGHELDELHDVLMGTPLDKQTLYFDGGSGLWKNGYNGQNDLYNVLDYGALGDGVADDTDGIQAAIEAAHTAGGGIVYLPVGTYLVTKSAPYGTLPDFAILLKPNVTLVGGGFSAQPNGQDIPGTVIKLANGQNCNVVSTVDTMYHYGCGVRHLAINGNRANNTSYSETRSNGIYITASDRFVVENCMLFQNKGSGIYGKATGIMYAMQPTVINSYIFRNKHGIQFEAGATDALVINCDIGENFEELTYDGKGIILGSGSFVTGCAIWGNWIGVMGYGSIHVQLTSCRIDYNKTHAAYLYGTKAFTFSGCSIYDNSAVGDNLHSAIYIDGGASFRSQATTFSGCLIGDSRLTSPDFDHKYAIEIDATNAQYVSEVNVSGCYLKGNASHTTNNRSIVLVNDARTLGGKESGYFQIYEPGGIKVNKVAVTGAANAATGLDHHQGYATDGTYHYVIDTAKISKYDTSWVLVDENLTPFTGLPGAIVHLCDGSYYDGKLYIPANDWNGTSTVEIIAMYDAVTLDLISYVDHSAVSGFDGAGIVCVPEHNTIYAVNYLDPSKVHCFDLETLAYKSVITTSNGPASAVIFNAYFQGIAYKDGLFYIVGNNGYIWVMDRTGLMFQALATGYAGSHEGCAFFNNQLYMLNDNRPTACLMRVFNVTPTAALHIRADGTHITPITMDTGTSSTSPITIANTGSWAKITLADAATHKSRISKDGNGIAFGSNVYWNGSAWMRDTWNGSAYPAMVLINHMGNKRWEFRHAPDNNAQAVSFYNAPLFVSGESTQPNVYSDKNSNSAPTARFNQAGTADILDLQDGGTSTFVVKDGGQIVVSKASGAGIKVDPAAPTYGWADLLGDIVIRDTTNPANPGFNVYQGGLRQYQFTVSDECFINFHIPHDYAPGTDIYIHPHWSHNSTLVTGGTVTWGFEVSYAKGHQQAAFVTPVTTTIQQDANIAQYYHHIPEVQLSAASPSASQIDTDNIETDGLILVRCYLSANALTVSSGGVPEPFLHYVDIHYQTTNIGTKNKAPGFYA